MRQAGRYLPEYRSVRENHSLYEMFFTPEIAANVTLMPIQRFGFDAAILFSDITAIAPALGLQLAFHEGPIVTPLGTPQNFASWPVHIELLEPIFEAARLVKQRTDVPLIGFCGGPFTVATYLVEEEVLTLWMKKEPESFAGFIDKLTDVSIQYLRGQIEAGVDALQIFDSWANKLSGEEFEKYSLKPLKKIIAAIGHPVIVYMRGSALRAEALATVSPAAISIDEGCSLASVRKKLKIPLQGNILPELLFSSPEVVRKETEALLQTMNQDPGFIVNLSHGILPKTPLDSVTALVDTVKNYF
jgi:uroporphyrinogen decarboxylase